MGFTRSVPPILGVQTTICFTDIISELILTYLMQGLEEDNKIRGFGLGKVVTRYIVDCVTPQHEGEYSCHAVSGGKQTTTDSTVVVVEGNFFILSCYFNSNILVISEPRKQESCSHVPKIDSTRFSFIF